MNTFTNIFSDKFLNAFNTGTLDISNILTTFVICILLTCIISLVYRLKATRYFYSNEFAVSLVALSLVTTSVILTVQTSVVVSLGMVGALSIVRFRTAIKSPLDLVFLFWSISVGIICGAGVFSIGIILTLVISIVLLVADYIPMVGDKQVLVIKAEFPTDEEIVLNKVKENTKFYVVKTRTVNTEKLEMVLELRCKKNAEARLLTELNICEGICYVSLLKQEGRMG